MAGKLAFSMCTKMRTDWPHKTQLLESYVTKYIGMKNVTDFEPVLTNTCTHTHIRTKKK